MAATTTTAMAQVGEQSMTKSALAQGAPLFEQHYHDLNLRVIGNCTFSALIDNKGCIVWSCVPRFDADPVFCSLLRKNKDIGFFDIEMQHFERSEQEYIKNTAILKTTLFDKNGNTLEMIDFCPFYYHADRPYRPTVLIRVLNATGRPRIRVRLRPTFGYGWGVPEKTRGSNHIRYLVPTGTLRLTSNAPIAYLLREVCFEVDSPIFLILMPDESLTTSIEEYTVSNLEKTQAYWEDWCCNLAIPFEWQPQVIRACITLKLMSFQETGAIISSATTSIPTFPKGVTRDERYCRLQDMPFLIRTLNRLGMAHTMTTYLKYISNIVSEYTDREDLPSLQPLYGISLETVLHEKQVHRLSGYRSHGPVSVGNKEYKEFSSDGYGSIILAMTQSFFDERLKIQGDDVLFYRLEKLGQHIMQVYKKPCHLVLGYITDSQERDYQLHIFPVVMCWAGLDRLAKISHQLGMSDREEFWQNSADEVREFIGQMFFNKEGKYFCSEEVSKGGAISAHVLLLPEVGFVAFDEPSFINTVQEVEAQLTTKEHPFILSRPGDNGHCFILFTIWYINALCGTGRMEEARKLFEEVLASCNGSGTVSETIDPKTKELWGNFPHTLTTSSLIYTALRLSIPWRNMI